MIKLFLDLIISVAVACQPCPTPSLQEAWKKADVVVVASQTAASPSYNFKSNETSGGNLTKIKVEKVFKGKLKEKSLSVRAW
jgi:hypothetical protein